MYYNAYSEAEVDQIIRNPGAKGVSIAKQPQKLFWGGYSSYFASRWLSLGSGLQSLLCV